MKTIANSAAVLCVSVGFVLLSGCGATPGTRVSPVSLAMQGRVQGGQQPVSGAAITLYAAGAGGTGLGAVELLAPHMVTTDANGFFDITGDYTCPSADAQMYIAARGGNPGLAVGTNNAALVLMTALGDCGALTSSTSIQINEITTVAAGWALAQFMGPNAAAGASATNATGLRNAFLIAKLLANTSTGTAPGALPPGGSTEVGKITGLANAIATCVNSDGGAGCSPLFAASTNGGVVPTNTMDAVLAIVRNPSAHVADVFNVINGFAPFVSSLKAVPNDWTMTLTYGECGSCGGLNIPGGVAIDSGGNAWVADYSGGVVSKFSPTGAAATATGFPGIGLRESYSVAVDGQDNAWVTNEESTGAAGNGGKGSISKFSSAGVEVSGGGYTGGGVYFPHAIAADKLGRMWVADYGDSSVSLLASDGSGISGAQGFAYKQLAFAASLAVDASNNVWVATQTGAAQVAADGTYTSYSCCNRPQGVALDPGGLPWIADYGLSGAVQLTSSGAVTNSAVKVGGLKGPESIASDGAGNMWVANYRGNSVSEIAAGSSTPISPVTGFGVNALMDLPFGLAVDASGNVWVSNAGSDTLTVFVGAAVPVKTPLLGLPVLP